MKSPFLLENETEYSLWREKKLNLYPLNINDISIELDIKNISSDQINIIKNTIKKYNYIIYKFSSYITDNDLQIFCSRLNLQSSVSNLFSDDSGISNITNEQNILKKDSRSEYIPYTNKSLNWHTDGYYYPENMSVKSFLLHCVNPAKNGGKNLILDHEVIYIFLRDHNPEYIDILMHNDVMEIPKNQNNKDSKNISGPVFYIDENGLLNMRFTSRQKNIIWKKNDIIKKIKNYIFDFITNDNIYVQHLLLKKNQGYLANNILHKREEYVDGQNKRLIKRLRFSKRI